MTGYARGACWIESFLRITNGLPSPRIFRLWAAITTISGALERKVWTRAGGLDLFPNLYTLLVAPPGVGKSIAINEAWAFWNELKSHHVAPKRMTKAGLVDTLLESPRRVARPGETPPFVEFHALLVASPEFGTLLPSYDLDFLNVMCEFYDSGPHYDERLRGKGERLVAKHPLLVLLAGVTPGYMISIMPDVAWSQGFMSRVLMIYHGEGTQVDLFSEVESRVSQSMVENLKIVSELFGQFRWEPAAQAAIQAWVNEGCPPAPRHPKLEHYNTRRSMHVIKLAMISSAARRRDLVVTKADFERALGWLLEAEANMPAIFKSLAYSHDGQVLQEVAAFVRESGGAVTREQLHKFLAQRIPAHSIDKVESLLKSTGILDGPKFHTDGGIYFVLLLD